MSFTRRCRALGKQVSERPSGAAVDGVVPAESATGASRRRFEDAGRLGKERGAERIESRSRSPSGKRIALYFQGVRAQVTLDRMGQKGRVGHRWWLRGHRPPGLNDKRFDYAYIFAAVEPGAGNDFCLVLPTVSAKTMNIFLRGFSEQLAPDVHAMLVVDDAGWHIADALQLPDNLTLVRLPPCAPELNPIERVWLYLRESFLSHRLHVDHDAIIDAACKPRQRLTPERLRSLCAYPWIKQVISWTRRYHRGWAAREISNRLPTFSN